MPHRLKELHNIMPIDNIGSVQRHGILSHEQAMKLAHRSDLSLADVQQKRSTVQVPGGLRLHQYANLYFDARNPMMYKRSQYAENICVLSVSLDILSLADVVISDQNAASEYVRFYPPSELNRLKFDQIYADNWSHPEDQIAHWRHKSIKCAEVLVPSPIHPNYIQKAYVVNETAKIKLTRAGFSKAVEIMPRLFFK